jgi:hypothetical protein
MCWGSSIHHVELNHYFILESGRRTFLVPQPTVPAGQVNFSLFQEETIYLILLLPTGSDHLPSTGTRIFGMRDFSIFLPQLSRIFCPL